VDQYTTEDLQAFVAAHASRTDLLAAVADLAETALDPRGPASDSLHRAASMALHVAAEMERRVAEQASRIAELEGMALFDELTGILNRRGFLNDIDRALAEARRHGSTGVLIYVDLDGFKAINDSLGHPAGDEVLRHSARILRDNVRTTDSVGRLGGDEFGVLLTRTSWKDGLMRAEALERRLNAASIPYAGCIVSIRASFGIQAYSARDNGAALLAGADDAMYRTKRHRSELVSGPRVAA
jgi:diguanylate cyclase (GGDEF)-like protein